MAIKYLKLPEKHKYIAAVIVKEAHEWICSAPGRVFEATVLCDAVFGESIVAVLKENGYVACGRPVFIPCGCSMCNGRQRLSGYKIQIHRDDS